MNRVFNKKDIEKFIKKAVENMGKAVGSVGCLFMKNKWALTFALLSAVVTSAAIIIASQTAPCLTNLTKDFAVNYVQEHAEFMTSEKIMDVAELELAANASVEEVFTGNFLLEDGSTLRLFEKSQRVNLPAVIEGEKLDKDGCILINSTYAQAKGLNVGDIIKISGESFHISGLMALPQYIYPYETVENEVPVTGNFGLGIISNEDFHKLGAEKYANFVYFTEMEPENAKKISESFREKLSDRDIKISNWRDIEDNEHFTHIVKFIAEIKNRISFVAIIPLLVLCVIWLMFFTRQEFSSHLLIAAVITALIGGILGTFIGLNSLQPVLEALTAQYDLPVTDFKINYRYALAAVFAPAILIGALSNPVFHRFTIFPARNKCICISFCFCRPF